MFYEVDEQLRSARLQAMFRRSWPYAAAIAAAAVVVALIVWAIQQHAAAQAAKSSIAYSDAVQALSANNDKLARRRFDALASTGTPTYRALALMQEAGMSLKAGDQAAAAALEDQAGKAARDPVIADAARLEAAYLVMDTAPYQQVYDRLQPLTAAGRPYRTMAREALAMARLGAGHTAEAKGDFEVLALAEDTSQAGRNRAQAALALLRANTAGRVGAIAKGAIGLTPQPPPQPTLPGQTAPGAPAAASDAPGAAQ